MNSTQNQQHPGRTKGFFPQWLLFSILTILLWGVWGTISKAISDEIDTYMNQILFTLGLVPLFLFVLRSRRLSVRNNRKRGIFFAFLTGILGGTGNIAFFHSLSLGGKASAVVPITGLSPLVSVLLGLVVLRERMSVTQIVGAGVALVAIYLLSL